MVMCSYCLKATSTLPRVSVEKNEVLELRQNFVMFPAPLLLLARMFCSCQAKHPLMDSSNRGMLLSLLGPRGDSVKLESFREAEIFDTSYPSCI